MTRRILLALGVTVSLCAGQLPVAAPAMAQDAESAATAERDARLAELARLVEEIALTEEREAALRAEIAALDEDRAGLTESLIAANQRTQELEAALDAAEARMAGLIADETAVRGSLGARRDVLAEVLAAMQRMGRQPVPAILAQPEDALASVRSAILLGAVVPELRAEAEALVADIERLAALRDEQSREQARLLEDAGTLAEERERLRLLIADRQEAGQQSADALRAEEERAAALAAEAQSLEELIGSIGDRIAGGQSAADAADAATQLPEDADRIASAIPFASARGLLPRPASGALTVGFGEDDGLGGRTAGISIATRSGARISAPSDGWVEFAGPYRSYGNLLIVNAGDGYLVLLAGMERVDVRVGQFVLAGEPVGTMGADRVASAGAVQLGNPEPILYVEFRRDGTPIDPGPWWAQPY